MQNHRFPSDWQKIQLKDICSQIFSGGTPSTKEETYWNGNILWLSSGEIKKRYIVNSNQKITQAGIDNSSTKLAKKNDVLIASAGQGNTRGNVAFCLIDTYINQSLISLRTDKQLCCEKFLFFNLMNRYDELRNLSDSNSSRGSLTCEMMGKLPIFLPPLSNQQKVATTLSAYDDLIGNNSRRIKILKEMAQAIYRDCFIKDFQGEPSSTVSLQDICYQITDGKHGDCQDDDDSGYYFISCKDVNDDLINFSDARQITENDFIETHKRTQLEPDDIVITNSGTIGRMALVPDTENTRRTTFQKSVAIVKANKEKVLPNWLFYCLQSNRDILIEWAGGTAQKNLLLRDLRAFKVLLPPFSMIQTFENVIQPIRYMIELLHEKNTNLRRTRDLLLQKLMSGEIDVSGLDIRIPEAET